MHRNSTLEAYQMDNITAVLVSQNFTADYTEVDANNEITITDNRSRIDGDLRTPVSYVYRDFGAGGIADFSYNFEFYYDYRGGATNDWRGAVLCLWQSIGTRADNQQAENGLLCMVVHETAIADPELTLNYHWNGGQGWNDTDPVDGYMNYDQLYYFTIIKSGTSVGLYCYSNAGRSVLVEEATVTLPSNATYRYLYSMQSIGGASANDDGYYIQNLALGDTASGYQKSGSLQFLDMFEDLEGYPKWIMLNVTENGADTYLGVSDDQITWETDYNLETGWNVIYIEPYDFDVLKHISVGVQNNPLDSTPYFHNMTVIYSSTPGGFNYGYILIAIMIGLAMGIGSKWH